MGFYRRGARQLMVLLAFALSFATSLAIMASGCDIRDNEAKRYEPTEPEKNVEGTPAHDELHQAAVESTSKPPEAEKPPVAETDETPTETAPVDGGEPVPPTETGEQGEAGTAPVDGVDPATGEQPTDAPPADAPPAGEAQPPAEDPAGPEGEAKDGGAPAADPPKDEATPPAETPPTETAEAPAEEAKRPYSKGPSTIKLKNKKGTVKFPHRDHQDMTRCSKCHHNYESGVAPLGCKECHGVKPDAPTFKKAAHKRCKGCHKAEGGPEACGDCHG